MKNIFVFILLFSLQSNAEDFKSKAYGLIDKYPKELKPLIQDLINNAMNPDSQGGAEITKKEYDGISDMTEMTATDLAEKSKNTKTTSTSKPSDTTVKMLNEANFDSKSFNSKVIAISKMPNKTDLETANQCKSLSDLYLTYSEQTENVQFGGGEFPVVNERVTTKLKIPTDYVDVLDEEQSIIVNCRFLRRAAETSYTVANRVSVNSMSAGLFDCDECGPIANIAFPVIISKKISANEYQANMLSIDMYAHRAARKGHSPGKTILLSSETPLREVTGYVFAVYAGSEKVTMANGFDKKVPKIVHLTSVGATAILARFHQMKTWVSKNSQFKKTTRCIQMSRTRDNMPIIRFACVKKSPEYKDDKNWPDSLLD